MVSEVQETEQFVMDATSFLAYLRHDPGGPLVEKVLRHCAQCRCKVKISPVDLLNAYTQIAGQNSDMLDEVAALFTELPVEIAAFTNEMAVQAGQIYAKDPQLGLGGASSLCLSLSLGATLLTADKNLCNAEVHSLLVGPREETGTDPANISDAPGNGDAK